MVATKSIDFRKGHDGLAALVSSVLRENPFTGTVFVFRSRRADRLKLLYWDGTGLVMADLPLNFHPTAIRASAVLTTPIGVLVATGGNVKLSYCAALEPVAAMDPA